MPKYTHLDPATIARVAAEVDREIEERTLALSLIGGWKPSFGGSKTRPIITSPAKILWCRPSEPQTRGATNPVFPAPPGGSRLAPPQHPPHRQPSWRTDSLSTLRRCRSTTLKDHAHEESETQTTYPQGNDDRTDVANRDERPSQTVLVYYPYS
jgi:hypothetical protein